MSTYDVPGSNPANGDSLHPGCWAETDDDSLVYVEGVSTNENSVIYSIFDLTDPNNPIEYRDSMPIDGFEELFKNSPDKWIWHDKTPFPWQRVMAIFKDGNKIPSADQIISAAEKIAASRQLIKNKLKKDTFSHRVKNTNITRSGSIIIDKIQRAINELRK